MRPKANQGGRQYRRRVPAAMVPAYMMLWGAASWGAIGTGACSAMSRSCSAVTSHAGASTLRSGGAGCRTQATPLTARGPCIRPPTRIQVLSRDQKDRGWALSPDRVKHTRYGPCERLFYNRRPRVHSSHCACPADRARGMPPCAQAQPLYSQGRATFRAPRLLRLRLRQPSDGETARSRPFGPRTFGRTLTRQPTPRVT